MSLPQPLTRVRHPRLTAVFAIGVVILLIAGGMTLTQVGSPLLTFRIGVVGYLLALFGGAGYIALHVARLLDGV